MVREFCLSCRVQCRAWRVGTVLRGWLAVCYLVQLS